VALLDLKGNRRLLNGDYLTDQLCEVGYGPTELAGPNVRERLKLCGRCLVIHQQGNFPVALEHIARDVAQRNHRPARDVKAVDHAALDVVRKHGVTSAIVGIFANPARAEHVAVTDFEKFAFELVCHAFLLFTFDRR
jgi:hypothetical protein